MSQPPGRQWCVSTEYQTISRGVSSPGSRWPAHLLRGGVRGYPAGKNVGWKVLGVLIATVGRFSETSKAV
jgi:hypothetical protein